MMMIPTPLPFAMLGLVKPLGFEAIHFWKGRRHEVTHVVKRRVPSCWEDELESSLVWLGNLSN